MKRLPSKADLLDLCPRCSKHKKLKLKKHLSGITPAEEKNLEHLQEHIDTSISQMRFYKAEKRRVLSNGTFKTTRFAIHDFSKYHNNGVMYNDLMISVLLWDEENKTYKWIYLDFVQKAEMGGEQDYYFVRGIWRWMLGLDQNLNYTYFSSSESLDPRTLFQVDNVMEQASISNRRRPFVSGQRSKEILAFKSRFTSLALITDTTFVTPTPLM